MQVRQCRQAYNQGMQCSGTKSKDWGNVGAEGADQRSAASGMWILCWKEVFISAALLGHSSFSLSLIHILPLLKHMWCVNWPCQLTCEPHLPMKTVWPTFMWKCVYFYYLALNVPQNVAPFFIALSHKPHIEHFIGLYFQSCARIWLPNIQKLGSVSCDYD